MDIKIIFVRLVLFMLITSLCACVVVPRKVASYDKKCQVAVQKIALEVAPIESDNDWTCTGSDCALAISEDLAQATFTATTSALVSGSVALAGNTLYWLERNGECPHQKAQQNRSTEQPLPAEKPANTNDEYTIEEEIITARS